MVVDFAASGLDDVDILATDRILDLKTALANRELREDSLTRRNAEGIADGLDQLWMRLSAEDYNVASHSWRCSFWLRFEVEADVLRRRMRDIRERVGSLLSRRSLLASREEMR